MFPINPIHWIMSCVGVLALLTTTSHVRAQEISLGKPRQLVIHVEPGLMAANSDKPARSAWTLTTESALRGRLARSVEDLSKYLSIMTGSPVPIQEGPPAALDDQTLVILVGDLASDRFGKLKISAPGGQACRLVVSQQAIGLIGETDLGTSYAIYELLHRLGCRWFIPSEMGEVIPRDQPVILQSGDESMQPSTVYRGLSFTTEDFARRNRLGGLILHAQHALEGYISPAQRKEHPEWIATIDGKPSRHRLKWSAPGLADAIAQKINDRLDKSPDLQTASISPRDGLGFDNSAEDRALDADDFDPSAQMISLTDRLLWFCNQIADKVAGEHPDARLGMLAYINYARPPVRESVHPNIVPQFAPITYSRAHPIVDDNAPDNISLRRNIEGWTKISPAISYYFYGFYLAETASPNPMITKWSKDVPFALSHGKTIYWQPESLPNFETTAQAHYLGMRLAWDKTLKPEDIIQDFNTHYYGQAASQMAEYWQFIDSVWVDTPEYSGCGWGHLVRWTPERLKEARRLMNQGKRAAQTPVENQRITMADESLKLFEYFMLMRNNFAQGKWKALAHQADAYLAQSAILAERYKEQYAFTSGLHMGGVHNTLNMHYFRSFYLASYESAASLARDHRLLLDSPLREWKYQIDKDEMGLKEHWQKPAFNDASWKTTDAAKETWSTLGYDNYFGSFWYRNTVTLNDLPGSDRVYLWIGAYDGDVNVYVNGKPCDALLPGGKLAASITSYAKPASFDITDALKKGENQITIHTRRVELNELHTGGLMGPATIYTTPVPVQNAATKQ